MRLEGILATALILVLSACSGGEPDEGPSASPTQQAGAGGEVGVFTWWADGSEKAGLDALVAEFRSRYPADTFVNLAVAGGAGSNAKAELAAELAEGDPPDSFLGHAGAELHDYILADQLEPVNDVIESLGGTEVFPEELLQRITVDGSVYSVPANVHRANVVWVNPDVLDEGGVGHEAPGDVDAWLEDLEALERAGVEAPLAVGGAPWTQLHLFETVLLAELGADEYNELFATGDWEAPDVASAVEKYGRLLSHTSAEEGDDWPQAVDQVIDGEAAYTVMGDWAVAHFTSRNRVEGEDYLYWPAPGTDGTFLFLADSFTLPVGAPNPGGAVDWLETVGSVEGQLEFNLAKGSIPARIDVPTDEFSRYQRSAMESYRNDRVASSIAHGAAVPMAWSLEMTSAISRYQEDRDDQALHRALVAAAENHR